MRVMGAAIATLLGVVIATAAGAARAEAIAVVDAAGAGSAYRSEVERAWFQAGALAELRGAQTRRRALELGVNDLEPAARALIASTEGDVLENRLLAVRLAPDLPIAHVALAAAYFEAGEYRQGLSQLFVSIAAIPRHVEASLWLAGSLLLMLATVLVGGSMVFIFAVGIAGFARAAHDFGDLLSSHMPGFARAALLCALIGVPLALGEGLFGLLLGILGVGVVYGGPRHRVVLALASVLFLVGLYPVLQLAGTALSALEADPVATASLALVRGSDAPAQVALLGEAELKGDELAARVLAVRARRTGDHEQARTRFQQLMEERAADPLVLNTLGNMAFSEGRTEDAIVLYERAQAVEESAVLMFNLSQAYARAFRMEEFELTMQRAQRLDADIVAELSGMEDPDFVADVAFPMGPIRDRMLEKSDGRPFVAAVASLIAPGLLGESPLHVAGGFGLVLLSGLLLTSRYQHAGGCSRCGKRICARCDDSMWSSDLCDGCHHLFTRPQGTDPKLRMARVQALRKREARVEKVATTASLIVPGVSGLLARRPDLSFVSILFFGAAAALFVWRDGVVPDPLTVGSAGAVAFVAAGTLMALLYTLVMLSGIVIRRSQ